MGEEMDAAVQREQLVGDAAGTGGQPNPTEADGGAGGMIVEYFGVYRTVNGARVPIYGSAGGGRPDGGSTYVGSGMAGGGGRGGAVVGAAGGNGGVGGGWSSSWAVGGGGGSGRPTFRVADYEYGVRHRFQTEPSQTGMTREEAERWIAMNAPGIDPPFDIVARPRGDWLEATP